MEKTSCADSHTRAVQRFKNSSLPTREGSQLTYNAFSFYFVIPFAQHTTHMKIEFEIEIDELREVLNYALFKSSFILPQVEHQH